MSDDFMRDNDPHMSNDTENQSDPFQFNYKEENEGEYHLEEPDNNSSEEEVAQEETVYHTEGEENPIEISDPVSKEENENSMQKDNKFGSRKKMINLIASAAVFGFVAGIVFWGVTAITGAVIKDDVKTTLSAINAEAVTEGSNKIKTTTTSSGLVSLSTDVSQVVENTMPSIVSITSTITQSYDIFGQNYDEEAQGSGSGIVVGKNDKELLVVTNNHVVEGASEIGVTFIDEEVVTADIKGTDATADLAVIAIKLSDIKEETLQSIKIASLGSSDDIKVGQMAVAIGNALGYGQSVTVGYISAKDREVSVGDTAMVLLQTDAAINPGNSGGALLNINGEVIGINSVKYASSAVEGMGYAIPISRATPIINELMNREDLKEEEKGYLGITGADVSETEQAKYNIPVGIYINEVSKDGAAGEAGILSGDIITGINGIEVQTIATVQEKVNSYRVGTEITLTVMRTNDGVYEEKEFTVVLKGSKTLDSLKTDSGENTTKQKPAPEEEPDEQGDNGKSGEKSKEDILNDLFGSFNWN